MRFKNKCYRIFLTIFIVFAVFLTTHTFGYGAKKDKGKKSDVMTEAELRSALMSFADSFAANYSQVMNRLEGQLKPPQERVHVSRHKYFGMSAAIEIAANSNPGVALMDMLVFVTLNRIVWEEYWQPKVFGESGIMIGRVLRKQESDIWSIGAKTLTSKQQREFRELIREWRKSHPEIVRVNFIRFSDFGELGRKPALAKVKRPGGLLAPVKEAVEAADEIRATADRAIYLINRMHLLIGTQIELLFLEIANKPEVTQLLYDTTRFRETSEKFVRIIEQLPDKVTKEREAAVQQVGKLIEKEQAAFFKGFDKREANTRRLIGDVHTVLKQADNSMAELGKAIKGAESLVAETKAAGLIFNDLVQSVDHLTARFMTDESKSPSKPFDILEYTAALKEVKDIALEMDELVDSIDNVVASPAWENLFVKLNEATEKRVDHIFWRLVLLVLITAACVLILVPILRFSIKRPSPAKS
jgi:hypothetical protein